MPEISVPLAVYTGWNFVADPAAPNGYFNDMVGSTLPFSAATVTKRYGNREAYRDLVKAKAQAMVGEGLLLERDVTQVVDRAGKEWDWLISLN